MGSSQPQSASWLWATEDQLPEGLQREAECHCQGHLCLCNDFLFLLLKKQQHLVSSATSTSAGAVMGALE